MKRLLLFLKRLIGKAEKPLLHTSEKDVTPITFDIFYLSCRLELTGLVSKKIFVCGAGIMLLESIALTILIWSKVTIHKQF